MIYVSNSADDTFNIGKKIAENLKPGDIVLLNGDLGAGKTVITKGICDYFNVKSRVMSPTYTIVNEYLGDIKIYHFDIYRLNDWDELYNIGFTDYLCDDALMIVEWSDNIPEAFEEQKTIRIDIKRDDNLKFLTRKIIVEENI